jgi:hypothetical protein
LRDFCGGPPDFAGSPANILVRRTKSMVLRRPTSTRTRTANWLNPFVHVL